ncbi:MAG: hypothetical protein A3F84_28795 [Candidatus Handelsmanbacteria bacterium RIFCSPLOWO2_12_FULL_64_10]|uniref:Uncharacterized protein n=1 Tax=Handelsmanbacteria sp. (strain RIFCSPLOWO2_12_FULL_64_10) TaxID=1817868 RepID=A0A1F6D3X5_HANXR|nr:MAG: hypothetical protein A3F84_28795 [Candidatus Handelsmanbacteria bacterium RIFCSPLOWO2_12_FULL_64_10]
MRNPVLISFLCFLWGTMPVGADEGVWVTCTGRAALHHITPEEARISQEFDQKGVVLQADSRV